MPRSLILHIGTMKTGSTTIQYLFDRSRPALAEQGVHYLQSKNHLLVAFMFTSKHGAYDKLDASIWKGNEPIARLEEYRVRFGEEIQNLPVDIGRVIISSEQFSQLVTEPDDIQRLCDFLSEFFEDIKVVVYLRRQDAHLASMYSQRLRRGIKSEPAYMLRGQIPGYDYAALLANWAAAFGRNAICPRLFERDTNKSFDVIDDFVEACGLLPLDKAVLEGQPLNPSMNRSGQRILREMIPYLEERDGRQFARGMSWKRLTAAVTEALPGQGWRPSQAEAVDYMKRFSDINETVRRAWFPERESLFSMDFSSLPEESIVEDSEADQLATYKLLWHLLKENVDSEAATIRKRIMSEQEAGDLPRRRGALMRVVRSNLSDLDARLELARLLIEEGEIDQAVFNLRQVLRRAPDHQQAIDLLRELAAQSEREAAEEEAARASVDNS